MRSCRRSGVFDPGSRGLIWGSRGEGSGFRGALPCSMLTAAMSLRLIELTLIRLGGGPVARTRWKAWMSWSTGGSPRWRAGSSSASWSATEKSEAVLDALERQFTGTDGFRVILLTGGGDDPAPAGAGTGAQTAAARPRGPRGAARRSGERHADHRRLPRPGRALGHRRRGRPDARTTSPWSSAPWSSRRF